LKLGYDRSFHDASRAQERPMSTVRYEAPRSIPDAVRLIHADPRARILGGGTDLLIQFRAGMQHPTVFVDVKRIPELVSVSVGAGEIRIGASAAAAVVCEDARLRQLLPGLIEAVHLIGSTQIQGRATIGGNLCNASPAADSTCALIVNRADCVIAGPAGERRVPVEKFCTAPGRTVLERGELLTSVVLPRPGARTGDAYLRLIPRSEMDIAVAGAAVSVTLDGRGVCTAARVAIGAVAPTALLVPAAADALVGSTLDEPALARAADAARAAARPIDDKRGTAAYRRQVAGVLVKRACAIAAKRAASSPSSSDRGHA
jgi:carbon-monoxide dehydrogenase medium subunit